MFIILFAYLLIYFLFHLICNSVKFIASCCSLTNLVAVWICYIIKLQHVSSFSTYKYYWYGWCYNFCMFKFFSNIFRFFYNKIFVTSALKESRIINMYVITDTGYINHTIRKYNISRGSDTWVVSSHILHHLCIAILGKQVQQVSSRYM